MTDHHNSPPAPTDEGVGGEDDVVRFMRKNRPAILADLSEWVRIPSISAQPEHAVDTERSAHWLAGALRDLGLTTELITKGDSVAVLGLLVVDETAPTVLIYSHHDVRHAKPEEWLETDPFEPVLRDGRLYGRGASDAKGQVIAHRWGLRAHLQRHESGAAAGVNLVYLIEGEEEMGSPHFAEILSEQADRLARDVVVFSDTLQWKEGNPAIVTSMRGMISATLTVRGPERDVHSGAVSGVSPNPLHVLVDVLSQLHSEERRIALPGFYDDVDEITPERAEELRTLAFDDDTWLERTETRSMRGEESYSPTERLWARPSLEMLSLLAGDPEGIARAVIPSEATAELNIRTVPSQKVAVVAGQLKAFFSERMPDEVEYTLQVDEETGQEPYVTPDGDLVAALERAVACGTGSDIAGRMGNAGGGPAELLARTLGALVLFLGTGLPEDHWHSSDESIDVDMLLAGAATITHLWTEIGELLTAGRGGPGSSDSHGGEK